MTKKVAAIASAYEVLKWKDSRSEYISKRRTAYVEMNTIPFNNESLIPQQAAAAGISWGFVYKCNRIIILNLDTNFSFYKKGKRTKSKKTK
jgi:hypothetical protein